MILSKITIKKDKRENLKALCISAIASNQGKTILCTALLYHYKKSVRAFKIGPDYIDPQFHEKVCGRESINLDTFMMSQEQVNWMFDKYNDQEMAILEGVMGFYDGMDKGCSAYQVSTFLQIPTLLVLDGSGSYITISAVLKGLKSYKNDNTIKAIVLNKLSSKMHYELIKKQILKDFADEICVLGWIKKDLQSLGSTHLGLDLNEAKKEALETLSKEVLENINLDALEKITTIQREKTQNYPFEKFKKIEKKIAIVKDENFSFLYHDNLVFLQEIFKEVEIINAKEDESISENTHAVFIPGGYIEVDESYKKMSKFKNSLIKHAQDKHVYAECAGLLYLSNKIDDKKMSGILDIDFELKEKRSRLGYYYASNGLKGHAFHYTSALNPPKGVDLLSKNQSDIGSYGAWRDKKVYGTYLHVFFRNNMHILKEYFGI